MSRNAAIQKENRTAIFSEDRIYRYTLEIVWDASLPLCHFTALNPSTADEFKDDPTIRREKNFAKAWGFGGIIKTNLFAFRATNPMVMKAYHLPIGERFSGNPTFEFTELNDKHIFRSAGRCAITVAAWGNHGKHMRRDESVVELLSSMGIEIKCFRITKQRCPEHPLYMAADTRLITYKP